MSKFRFCPIRRHPCAVIDLGHFLQLGADGAQLLRGALLHPGARRDRGVEAARDGRGAAKFRRAVGAVLLLLRLLRGGAVPLCIEREEFNAKKAWGGSFNEWPWSALGKLGFGCISSIRYPIASFQVVVPGLPRSQVTNIGDIKERKTVNIG